MLVFQTGAEQWLTAIEAKGSGTSASSRAAAVAGTTLFSKSLFASLVSKEMVGIQLYSIRKDMEKDPMATLKQLAEMGYKYVEHANYVDRKFYGQPVAEFKKT